MGDEEKESPKSGKSDKFAGAVKEYVGVIVRNSELESEGAAQRALGHAEYAVNRNERLSRGQGRREELKGSAKLLVGKITKNKEIEEEGKKEKEAGRAKIENSNVIGFLH